MQTSLERIEECKVVLEVTVPADELDKAMSKAFRDIAQKVNIPGFRKGKAPRKLIEARVGPEAVLEEAIDLILPDAYTRAVEETGIKPIDRPEVKVIKAEVGSPVVFTATVMVEPEVELGQYKGIEAEQPSLEVSAADVEKSLESIRERAAKMVAVEDRTVQNGDYVQIDFVGSIDGIPFEGGSGQGFELNVGSGTFIPGFEEQLVGAARKETRTVEVKFPADYQSEGLAGKDAAFEVTVQEIKQKELPEPDDEFVKTVSQLNTYEELRLDIENRLKQMTADNAKRKLESLIVGKAVDNASVQIPAVMVERRLDRTMKDMAAELEQQGTTLENYCEYMNKTMEELRQNFYPGAEREIKTDLVLTKIAGEEGLGATAAELEEEIGRLAKAYSQEPDFVRQRFAEQGTLEVVEESISLRKAVDFLVSNASVKQSGEAGIA